MTERFDELSRQVAGAPTRRGVLKMIGAAFGAAAAVTVLKPARATAFSCGPNAVPCGAGTTPCGICCCKAGVACRDASASLCGCAAGAQPCGSSCCAKGETCSDPANAFCCPAGTTPCGKACCRKGVACTSQSTSTCGGQVAACLAPRAICGSVCCDVGQTCVAGTCVSCTCTAENAACAAGGSGCTCHERCENGIGSGFACTNGQTNNQTCFVSSACPAGYFCSETAGDKCVQSCPGCPTCSGCP